MKKVVTVLILVLILLMGISSGLAAEEQPTPEKQNIKLNFKGVDLRDAFRALADIANMNVITDNSVEGEVTIALSNISFYEAIELLAKTNGLDYKIVNNTVLIGQADKLRQGFGKKATRVFKLDNADPQAIKKSISSMINPESIKIDERTDSLIITAYEEQFTSIQEVITSLDAAKRQIVIQARIEEVSHEGLKELGIDWDFGSLQVSSGDSSSGNNIEVGNVSLSYTSMLDMLEENNNATVLANPQITTIEGKEANINIGDEVPIVKTDSEDNPEVEFKDVGINLNILPRVTEGNKVFISVTPEVSVVSNYIETQGGKYPVVSTRKAQTNVKVKTGETIALGGLIKEEEMKKMSKVPVLGSLPVLGKLFQEEKTEREKRELIIFLTPKIIETQSADDSKNLKTSIKSNEEEETARAENQVGGIVPIDYKVKEDETLWGIGQKFNVFYAKIVRHNNLRSQGQIRAGQILEVPVPKKYYYRVKEGDTLDKIAQKYQIKVERIKEINGIDSLEGKYGMQLVLPVEVKPNDRVVDFSKDMEAYQKHMND